MFGIIILEQMFENIFSLLLLERMGVDAMREQKSIYCMTDRELRTYKRKLRRQRELRHRMIKVAMTVCLLAACILSYRAIRSSASTGEEEMKFKYYTGVIVQYGETLWELADSYIDYTRYESKSDYLKEVCNINHIAEESDIRAGQRLVMPYYSVQYIK